MKRSLLVLSLSLTMIPMAHAGFFERIFGAKDNNATDNEVTTNLPVEESNDEIRIVIDRNPAVQQMKVYLEGKSLPDFTYPISTGRETFDLPTNFRRNPECSFTPLSKSDKPFGIQRLNEMHMSDTWLHKDEATGKMVGSAMPHSIFFNGGIAMHSATGDGIAGLGPKTGPGGQAKDGSGGCVRMNPCDAENLFMLFAKTRPMTAEEKRSTSRTEADNTCPESSLPPGQAYDRINASTSKECRNSSSPRCTDPNVFPIRSNGRKAQISVIDTRSPEELKKVTDACDRDTRRFNARKSKCMLDKVVGNIQATGGSYDKAAIESDATARGKFLSDSLKGLTEKQRSDFNYECNKEIFYEKVTAKCHMREIKRMTKGSTFVINQGMYDMKEVAAIEAQQQPAQMERINQLCAAEIASMMYVSPSDPAPRPTTVPIPKPRPN